MSESTITFSPRIAAALESPCPDPTCEAEAGEFCFPGAGGFHAARYEAAGERLAIAAAQGIGRGPIDDIALENAERHQRQRGNPAVHHVPRPSHWWEKETS
jgi:hypothetical protein